jgi:hypothetical protein
MNTVADRCAAAQAVMDHVCNEYMQNPNAQLIDLMLEGQSELQRCGLGAYSQVHPKKTLIHPRNRGHAMLEISSVSAQVADISDVSFSLHEVLQAAAVRMPAIGTAERQAIEKLNENLVSASLGTLAPVVRDDAEIQVVGCSHNTAGLKAICCRAKCDIERISEDGRYNASKIIGRCPSYKSAIEHGLRYFIVEYIVETKWPHFVDLTIEACNIGSSVAKPDTVLQLMSKAHQHALQTVGSNMNSTELYALIERKMARTKPALADMLPEICAYVKDWSGGQNPIFLTALLQFARTLDMPQYDYVNKAMLTKINKIDLGVGLGGRYRVMIIKLCLAKGINGISSAALVSLSKRGTNQHTLAIKAEEEADVFEKAILKISKNDAWGGEVLRQIGLFDNDVVAYVHHMNKKFKSFKEIQAHHFDHILVLLKAKSKNPFRDEQIKKVKGGEPMQKNMQELGATGMSASNLMIVAKGKGLDVGAIVANKGGTYIILSIDEDDSIVTLQLKGDKRRKSTVFLQDLVDNFKPDEGNKTLVNRSNRSKSSICITRANRWFRTLRSIVPW